MKTKQTVNKYKQPVHWVSNLQKIVSNDNNNDNNNDNSNDNSNNNR